MLFRDENRILQIISCNYGYHLLCQYVNNQHEFCTSRSIFINTRGVNLIIQGQLLYRPRCNNSPGYSNMQIPGHVWKSCRGLCTLLLLRWIKFWLPIDFIHTQAYDCPVVREMTLNDMVRSWNVNSYLHEASTQPQWVRQNYVQVYGTYISRGPFC